MPAWTGRTINHVIIGELIARGGMAEVYFGEHVGLNRKVAVKIMRDHLDDDPNTHSRFAREAQVIASLSHPNIIQIYDYTLLDEHPCLIMELVPGVSLGAYMKSLHERGQKLPLDVIARILSSLASAVDHAHKQNIVHRDIKPANVLLRGSRPVAPDEPLPEDVEPVLTDFGLVRLLDSTIQTSTGTVTGTPAYMSPEQARGDKVDKRTDIYSLGVLLYEMLAGAVPFDAESSLGVLMKHLNDPPPPIAGISRDLQAVINRALSKDSALRYRTARELADEFTAVSQGGAVSPDTRRAAEGPKPKRTFLKIYAAVGVSALVLLGLFILRPFLPFTADPDRAVGRITYSDFNYVLDRATVTTFGLPFPKAGSHYEVWHMAEGGEIRRNIGRLSVNDQSQGRLVFIHPDQENILSLFDQVEITVEPDNDPNPDEPSGEIAASSIFPPLALTHVRHILVSHPDAPDSNALIQGLWYTADGAALSVTAMREAFDTHNETLFRMANEEIINLLVGSAHSDLYRDWNNNGTIDDPGDGFGLLENGEQGYIPATISHSRFAAEASDATENIKLHSAHVVICAENMEGWSEQLLELALQAQEMPFSAELESLLAQMNTLSHQILAGVDSNGNDLIEPIVGEGGADTAYEHAYYMAEMPLLPGEGRIPPPASTP